MRAYKSTVINRLLSIDYHVTRQAQLPKPTGAIMQCTMEGASGHNDLSKLRRGASTPWYVVSTPRRGTNHSKDVPQATAWSRQIRHCSPHRGVDAPHHGAEAPRRGLDGSLVVMTRSAFHSIPPWPDVIGHAGKFTGSGNSVCRHFDETVRSGTASFESTLQCPFCWKPQALHRGLWGEVGMNSDRIFELSCINHWSILPLRRVDGLQLRFDRVGSTKVPLPARGCWTTSSLRPPILAPSGGAVAVYYGSRKKYVHVVGAGLRDSRMRSLRAESL